MNHFARAGLVTFPDETVAGEAGGQSAPLAKRCDRRPTLSHHAHIHPARMRTRGVGMCVAFPQLSPGGV
jgi:hypothetical protein